MGCQRRSAPFPARSASTPTGLAPTRLDPGCAPPAAPSRIPLWRPSASCFHPLYRLRRHTPSRSTKLALTRSRALQIETQLGVLGPGRFDEARITLGDGPQLSPTGSGGQEAKVRKAGPYAALFGPVRDSRLLTGFGLPASFRPLSSPVPPRPGWVWPRPRRTRNAPRWQPRQLLGGGFSFSAKADSSAARRRSSSELRTAGPAWGCASDHARSWAKNRSTS